MSLESIIYDNYAYLSISVNRTKTVSYNERDVKGKTGHYLNQYWSTFLQAIGVTKPRRIN